MARQVEGSLGAWREEGTLVQVCGSRQVCPAWGKPWRPIIVMHHGKMLHSACIQWWHIDRV